jgi:NAD(P)-dependent dehydrogenase (short-subunit alcohol dehydrogenase family)
MDFAIEGKRAHLTGIDGGLHDACARALTAEGVVLADAPEGCDIVIAAATSDRLTRSAFADDALTQLREGWGGVVDAVTAYRAALPTMVERHWGRFVWIGSGLAKSVDGDTDEIDAVATLGMLGLHKVITGEEAPNNVTANTVLRGGAVSDDEVAAAVAFFCSQGAGYLSGVTIGVDGGVGSAVF